MCRAFGLGTPSSSPRPLPGLSTAHVFGIETDRGSFVVKRSDSRPDPGPSTLERAARVAGVATARPIEPPTPAVGYWAELEGGYVRVSEAVVGAPLALPASPAVATWLGRTIAVITGLRLDPGVASLGPDAGLAGEAAVRAWATALPGHPALAATLREFDQLVAAAKSSAPPSVLTHRDLNARNILLAASGPVLLDFDHAGPATAWAELVHHTFLLACTDLGAEEPDPAVVRAAVRGYLDAGGEPGPAAPAAFASLLAGLAGWVGINLDNRAVLAQAAASLPPVLDALPRWSRLLAP